MATNINVNLSDVAAHRKPISIIGSTLGTQFFKAQTRASILDFEKKKIEVEQNGNKEIFLNRTPRRFRLTGHDIIGVNITRDAVGATKVVLNQDSEDERVSIPVTTGMEKIGMISDDALGKALRGDKNIIFSDPKKLANELNNLNNDEKNRCLAVIKMMQDAVKQLDSAIAENNKKANDYYQELLSSTPASNDVSNETVILNIGNKDEVSVID